MKRRGHPVRGGISGLILGFLIALDLSIFHIRAPDTLSVIGLPLIFMALGIALGIWAPFARARAAGAAPATPPPTPAPVPSTPTPPSDAGGAEVDADDADD